MNKIVIPSNLAKRNEMISIVNSKITISMKNKTNARRELEELRIKKELEKEEVFQ